MGLFDQVYGAGALNSVADNGLNAVPKMSGTSGGGFDWGTFGGFGLGAIGSVVGGIFQGQAMRAAAQTQANAANNAALAGLMGQSMAMSQNRLDRGYRRVADLQNIKAAQDARTDNYVYGMNAFLVKNQGELQNRIAQQAGEMRNMLAGKSMDALNSVIDTSNQFRLADNQFALGSLGRTQEQQLQERAGKFRAFFERPMETAEEGYRKRQEIGIALSPEARQLSQRERKGRIEEAVAIQRGVMDKMFGNYTPTFYG